MIFGQDRGEIRRTYREAWRKFRAGELLSPLEAQIAGVIEEHPEYHDELASGPLDADYSPADGRTNPFLHMGLHLSIREQLNTGRPPGLAQIYRRLERRFGDAHVAEHHMLDALAETLWEAQRAHRMPDDAAYLERLKKLL